MNRIIQLTALMSVVAFIAIAEARALQSPRGAAKVAQSEQFNGETALMNINNMSMWFRSDGWSGRDPLTGNSGVSFPRGTDYTIFADGLIFGGYVRDGVEPALRVGGQTYEIGTVPEGSLAKGLPMPPMRAFIACAWTIKRAICVRMQQKCSLRASPM